LPRPGNGQPLTHPRGGHMAHTWDRPAAGQPNGPKAKKDTKKRTLFRVVPKI